MLQCYVILGWWVTGQINYNNCILNQLQQCCLNVSVTVSSVYDHIDTCFETTAWNLNWTFDSHPKLNDLFGYGLCDDKSWNYCPNYTMNSRHVPSVSNSIMHCQILIVHKVKTAFCEKCDCFKTDLIKISKGFVLVVILWYHCQKYFYTYWIKVCEQCIWYMYTYSPNDIT